MAGARYRIGLIRGAQRVDHAGDFGHQCRLFEQQSQLGVGKGRAQIEVERADDGLPPGEIVFGAGFWGAADGESRGVTRVLRFRSL